MGESDECSEYHFYNNEWAIFSHFLAIVSKNVI